MKNIVKFFFLLVFSFSFGQKKNALSDGALLVDEQREIPVKIFSNPDLSEILSGLETEENVLVILSRFNTEARNHEEMNYFNHFYNEFQQKGYKVIGSDFKQISSWSDAKYILKVKDLDIDNHSLKLKTTYKIWNPKEGIEFLGLNVRFYGLMFVLAFGLGLFIMRQMFRIDNVDEKYLDSLFMWTIFGTIFGARLGHVIFYEAHLFIDDFWSVFLPIRTKPTIEFTGFSGLASHGAAIALILTTLYYSLKVIKKNPFWVYDRLGIVVALAGFFIRMGNFFNSEIIGKPIDPKSPLAIYFPQQSLDYGAIVPRYPTQLIEAISYLCLFILLGILYRFTNKKYQQGWLFGMFFAILWSIRFFAEFLKEPQGEEYISFLGMNTGQILSLPFILAGIGIIFYSYKQKSETN